MKGLRFLMAYGGAFLIVAALFYLLLVYGFGLEKRKNSDGRHSSARRLRTAL